VNVAVGCDHAGFELKNDLLHFIERAGHAVVDCGTNSSAPVDYPDFAVRVGEAILAGRATRAVLICGSGVGASVAANKLAGIRAGVCHDTYSAHQCVEHDDVNVLCLGARVIGVELAHEIVRQFLAARFTGEERHLRRLGKVQDLERRRTP